MIVRFIDGQDLHTPNDITSKQLQVLIKQTRPDYDHIRILWRGRFVDDDELFAGDIVVHCINSNSQNTEPNPVRIGFDRLIDMGFDESEVRDLRQQFHALRGVDSFDSRQIQEAEEDWIENTAIVQESEFDMLQGLLLGFFCGIFILFWVKERMYSKKQQQGIFTGLILNLSFGLFRLL